VRTAQGRAVYSTFVQLPLAANLKSKQSESTKVKILEHALLLFSEKGFDGASTRDIAIAAGVNHALIKYHFGNKELLWRAAVDLLFQRQLEYLDEFNQRTNDEMSVAKRFRLFVQLYVRYCAEHPEHARIMVQESTGTNPRLEWAVNKHLLETRDTLDELFIGLFEADLMPRMPLLSLRYMLTAACQNVFTLSTEISYLYGVDSTHEAQIKQHTDAVIRLFIREP
jgi:AcrR family transcriptional regulator